MSGDFIIKGNALEDIKCGDTIELDPRNGHTRRSRYEHKCPTKFICSHCGKGWGLVDNDSLDYLKRRLEQAKIFLKAIRDFPDDLIKHHTKAEDFLRHVTFFMNREESLYGESDPSLDAGQPEGGAGFSEKSSDGSQGSGDQAHGPGEREASDLGRSDRRADSCAREDGRGCDPIGTKTGPTAEILKEGLQIAGEGLQAILNENKEIGFIPFTPEREKQFRDNAHFLLEREAVATIDCLRSALIAAKQIIREAGNSDDVPAYISGALAKSMTRILDIEKGKS